MQHDQTDARRSGATDQSTDSVVANCVQVGATEIRVELREHDNGETEISAKFISEGSVTYYWFGDADLARALAESMLRITDRTASSPE